MPTWRLEFSFIGVSMFIVPRTCRGRLGEGRLGLAEERSLKKRRRRVALRCNAIIVCAPEIPCRRSRRMRARVGGGTCVWRRGAGGRTDGMGVVLIAIHMFAFKNMNGYILIIG